MVLKFLKNGAIMVWVSKKQLCLYDAYDEELSYYDDDLSLCSLTMSYVDLYIWEGYVGDHATTMMILLWLCYYLLGLSHTFTNHLRCSYDVIMPLILGTFCTNVYCLHSNQM